MYLKYQRLGQLCTTCTTEREPYTSEISIQSTYSNQRHWRELYGLLCFHHRMRRASVSYLHTGPEGLRQSYLTHESREPKMITVKVIRHPHSPQGLLNASVPGLYKPCVTSCYPPTFPNFAELYWSYSQACLVLEFRSLLLRCISHLPFTI